MAAVRRAWNQLKRSRSGLVIVRPAARVKPLLEFDDIRHKVPHAQSGILNGTVRESVEIVIVTRVSRGHHASAMRLLMEDCGFLPERPLSGNRYHGAGWICEELRKNVCRIGPDHMWCGRNPRRQRANLQTDVGPQVCL